ncbi:carbohydrate ABC transporter permease [Paenibacillus sp. GCM10023248]|uniref:carbohydrate ABC transporter permease n=1 Tax=Bacillales TaxID=1385 RepID=UPI002378DEBD|nr:MULTISPECIES: carbohydrate ABC transporter permease [Bacillales]MDD9268620.1 carbohydrate ABC transporter permease [Paenibacillus sp. MAHUQ-63]MDR6879521.1 putative aldouronate transport system permease protein [Bacillus sp. 3255]
MSKQTSLFDLGNAAMFLMLGLGVVVPFLYMIAVSLSSTLESAGGHFYFIPKDVMLDAYRYLFSTNRFVRSLGNSVYISVVGTFINLFVSISLSYALSKKKLPGRRSMLMFVFITMLFGGGLIPHYLLIKSLGMINTYWALLLPGATNAFTVLVMKTFFQTLPESLEEAARIDGAGEIRIMMSIVLPLSKPILATFSLFFMVHHWNEFFGAVIYLSDASKWPIQVLLRQMVVGGTAEIGSQSSLEEEMATSIGNNVKMAAILVAMLPIVVVYPFLQKYFAKGALVGSIKE